MYCCVLTGTEGSTRRPQTGVIGGGATPPRRSERYNEREQSEQQQEHGGSGEAVDTQIVLSGARGNHSRSSSRLWHLGRVCIH